MPLRIPLLMYHKVGAPVHNKADTFLNVSHNDFARQMAFLGRLGYSAVTFLDAMDGMADRKPLPRKPVCVTFDDGYTNVLEHAFPILQELGWPATVFVPTAYTGSENRWDIENDKPLLPIMDWEQLRRLHDASWEIAGHTRSHPHLERLDDADALREIEQGRDEIQDNLGVLPHTFCYPFGGLNDRTPGLVRQAGFIAACTTRSGLASPDRDPFLLPRVKIAYRDGLLGLAYRLIVRPRLP